MKALFFLRRKESGLAVIEAGLTFPIVLMMIFFILEMMRVNHARSSMDTMALEATMDFIANRNTKNFDEIVQKHKPYFLSTSSIKWYFAIYESLEKMCENAPYGSEDVYWPTNDIYSSTPTSYINSDDTPNFLARCLTNGHIVLSNTSRPESSFAIENDYPNNTLRNRAFVVTFVCDFKFSSEFVGTLFVGGANTYDKSKFLIWGRGTGICN